MSKRARIFTLRGALVVTLSAVVSACGGGGGDSEVGTGDTEGETFNGYVALRAMVSDDKGSGFSNEVEVNTGAGGSTSMTWEEPTHQMNGECLTSPITTYQIHYGTESRTYGDDPIIVTRDSTMLDCSAADSNECGDVVHCTATVEF